MQSFLLSRSLFKESSKRRESLLYGSWKGFQAWISTVNDQILYSELTEDFPLQTKMMSGHLFLKDFTCEAFKKFCCEMGTIPRLNSYFLRLFPIVWRTVPSFSTTIGIAVIIILKSFFFSSSKVLVVVYLFGLFFFSFSLYRPLKR